LTTGTPKFRGSGFVGMHVKPITAQEKFNFPRANVILARAQALLCMGTRLGFGRHEASHRLSEVRELRDACAEEANSTPPCMHVNS
jgi:hypothetical protein